MLRDREELRGHALYAQRRTHADDFVATVLAGVTPRIARTQSEFLSRSAEGDVLLTTHPCHGAGSDQVRSMGQFHLCRHALLSARDVK